ncbi:MAG: putative inorganic carbon transporter subunit DabA [Methylotenera sp.]
MLMGLFGVANSSDGDLRPGLPWQMVEVHDPIRLLIIVEHFPEVVLNAVQSTPEMYEWFINEWVHLVAVNPETHTLHYFKQGKFVPYETLAKTLPSIGDFNQLMEDTPPMRTNQLPDATKENLAVYLN